MTIGMENCGGVLKNLPVACLLLELKDKDWKVGDVNGEYCELMGLDRENILNISLADVFKERLLLNTVKASLNKAVETKKPVVFPYTNYGNPEGKSREGSSFWQITNIPLRADENHGIKHVIHIPWDKTLEVLDERKKAELKKELELKKSEREYFIQKNKDGLFALDQKGNFINVNSGLIKIAETAEKDLLGMSFLPFCAPNDREKTYAHFEEALKGKNQQFEAEFISGSGRRVHLDLSLVPMVVGEELYGTYGIARDVTELKVNEKTIREQQDKLLGSERKFRALVQESSDIIGILDEEGNYTFVSESADSVLGIPSDHFIGKNAFDFIHPEDKAEVINQFLQLKSSRQVKIPSFRFQDSTGAWRWLETTATNLTHDPHVRGIVVNSRDVTESKVLFNKIAKQNIHLNEVAWEHAHLVRSPLVKLKGILDLLEEDSCDRWSRKELLELLRESADELDEIIFNVVRKNEEIGKEKHV